MKTKICVKCAKEFTYEAKRGRPPVKCGPCKEGLNVTNTTEPDVVVFIGLDEDGNEIEVVPITRDWGGKYGIGTEESQYTFTVGDRVKISGENGTYKVYRNEKSKDGSHLLYGGDKSPNGRRGFRSIMPSRLSPDKRKIFIKEDN